jgi:DNA mismatch repair protein MutS2
LIGLSSLYKNNIEKLENEKKEILRKAKADADEFLKDINKKVENVIKQIRESDARKDVIKEAKKVISEIKDKSEKIYTPNISIDNDLRDFSVGSFVSIKDTATSLNPINRNHIITILNLLLIITGLISEGRNQTKLILK